MAQFPSRETEVLALAEDLAAGLTANPEIYASPPVPPADVRENGSWEVAGIAMGPEATLNGQERGTELEYRVIAANRAGEGEPSNTVMAVL